jgi:hypothetical protein
MRFSVKNRSQRLVDEGYLADEEASKARRAF